MRIAIYQIAREDLTHSKLQYLSSAYSFGKNVSLFILFFYLFLNFLSIWIYFLSDSKLIVTHPLESVEMKISKSYMWKMEDKLCTPSMITLRDQFLHASEKKNIINTQCSSSILIMYPSLLEFCVWDIHLEHPSPSDQYLSDFLSTEEHRLKSYAASVVCNVTTHLNHWLYNKCTVCPFWPWTLK